MEQESKFNLVKENIKLLADQITRLSTKDKKRLMEEVANDILNYGLSELQPPEPPRANTCRVVVRDPSDSIMKVVVPEMLLYKNDSLVIQKLGNGFWVDMEEFISKV